MNFLRNYKTVISNFGFLSILNVLDLGLPIVIIPFITQVIGNENFGIYIYVLLWAQNINLLTQYGFQFSAAKRISQNRDDLQYISRLSSNVLAARFLMASILVALALILSPVVFDSPGSLFMFITSLGIVFGDVFIPTWLFQGMERMKYVTIANATTKCLFALFVIIFIRRTEDYVYILALNSVGFLFSALLSMILARKQFGLILVKPQLKDILVELKDGFPLFGSTVGINLYRNLNVIILHFFVSDAAVGVYGLAEKVIKACQALIMPISQALFPHVSLKIKQEGLTKSLQLIRNASLIIVILAIVGCFCLWLFGDILVAIVGDDFYEALPLMYLMYPVILFGSLNFLLGFVGLINMGKQKQFFYSVFLSGTLALLFILISANHLGVDSAAIAMSLSEIVLTILCLYHLFMVKNNAR
ncbi:MAG: oligosaccharide flippase family protein [Bacteroidales bacterium]|nr:oligosaccharide flippase family protein [Bacteroidales bacterium]